MNALGISASGLVSVSVCYTTYSKSLSAMLKQYAGPITGSEGHQHGMGEAVQSRVITG